MTDIGCLVLSPTALQLLCAPAFTQNIDDACPISTCQPSGGGQVYEIRPGVNSQADWDAALAAMNSTGGNVIRFLPGEHPGHYDVRGSNHDPGPDPSGISGNHNCIDGNSQGGAFFSGADFTTVVANVDIRGASYWDIHNVRVTSSTGFGIRVMSAGGDASSPVQITNADISGTNHTRIVVQGWFSDQSVPSQYVDIHCPELYGPNGPGDPNPQTSEGLYIGSGTVLGVDYTNNIRVYNPHIYGLTSDAIDIKPGVDQIEIYNAYIHDLNFSPGNPVAAITINDSWTGAVPAGNVLIDGAVIHDVVGPDPGSFYGPVSVGDGVVVIRHLVEWNNLANNGVRIRPITDAVAGMSVTVECSISFDSQMVRVFNPDGISFTDIRQCNIDNNDTGVQFAGPTTGTADAGYGPGTGFVPLSGSTYNDSGGCCPTDIAGCPSNAPGPFAEAPQGV